MSCDAQETLAVDSCAAVRNEPIPPRQMPPMIHSAAGHTRQGSVPLSTCQPSRAAELREKWQYDAASRC
jgi:hypothetical protein